MLNVATRLLLRDELVGFAKSKVMIVLWVLLPAVAMAGYFLLPTSVNLEPDDPTDTMPLTYFMGLMLSSIAGTAAALLIGVGIVSEKTRKVYELFIVRPVNPSAILYAKFFAVFTCVSLACVISMTLGLGIDSIRGVELPPGTFKATGKSLLSLLGVIALSASAGILMAVLTKSILVVVLLILYVSQNLTIVPMLPTYFDFLPNLFWFTMLFTGVLTVAVLLLSALVFRRAEY